MYHSEYFQYHSEYFQNGRTSRKLRGIGRAYYSEQLLFSDFAEYDHRSGRIGDFWNPEFEFGPDISTMKDHGITTMKDHHHQHTDNAVRSAAAKLGLSFMPKEIRGISGQSAGLCPIGPFFFSNETSMVLNDRKPGKWCQLRVKWRPNYRTKNVG